jgi:uncharacterized protein (TIGR04255 family)
MPQREPNPLTEPAHEVYPSAPLRFVAFEARFSPIPYFETEDGRLAIYDCLRDRFPVLQQQPEPVIPRLAESQLLRVVDRTRTIAATVAPAAISLETSEYRHFNWFSELIENTLSRLARIAPIPTVQRVGLRYTDEIRVRGIGQPKDWLPYVDPTLLGPLGLVDGLTPEEHHAQVSFRVHDHHQVHLRYGALEGWSVDPGGPLRVPNQGAGPYFLIDLDSFWTAPSTDFPEFSIAGTVGLVQELHGPIRRLFEASITEQLRDQVLRQQPSIGNPGEGVSDANH